MMWAEVLHQIQKHHGIKMLGKEIKMSKKKIIACLLAVVMFTLSVAILPQITQAEGTSFELEEIVYDSAYQMKDYWTSEKKTAPLKNGYVFGGWYTSTDQKNVTPIKASSIDANNLPTENVYAKFVPAYVLSIMTQIQEGTTVKDEKTTLRLITTIDCNNYGNVGFDVWYNNKVHEESSETVQSKAYSSLYVMDGSNKEEIQPDTAFGKASKSFVLLKINGIAQKNFNKKIYVRPYWTTLDGTKVEGLAKYVHVEDGYSDYYSVPINLQSGKEIAGGVIMMNYPECLQVIATGNEVEEGRILKEMNYYVDTANHTIRFAANSDSTEVIDVADGILANVRFELKEGATADSTLNFTITSGGNSFSNWNEEYVNEVFAVNYRYYKEADE